MDSIHLTHHILDTIHLTPHILAREAAWLARETIWAGGVARSLAALARSRIKTQSHQNSDPNGVDSLTRCARSLVWGSLRSPLPQVAVMI